MILTIQSAKDELISLANLLLTDCKKIKNSEIRISTKGINNDDLIIIFEKAIQARNIKDIWDVTQLIDFNKLGYYKYTYHKVFKFLKKLIQRAIVLSIIASTIIVVCLAIIQLGGWFLCRLIFLYTIFCTVIIGILISFVGLIRILFDSLYINVFSYISEEIVLDNE